jgi:hypothetical protein
LAASQREPGKPRGIGASITILQTPDPGQQFIGQFRDMWNAAHLLWGEDAWNVISSACKVSDPFGFLEQQLQELDPPPIAA